ncbi:MAG: FecR domain-containing protein [Planctomycetes bacterium]|nr:FecR domain-containing protein [Planctomycetota bacterium]
MSPRDDYLWDRSGDGDATTRRLEQLLAGLAHDGRELSLDALPVQLPPPPARGRPRALWPWLLVAAAAAAAIVLAVSWPADDLRPGAAARTFVAAQQRLLVPLGELAEITLEPGSELAFAHWRPDQALFRLERGALSARVAPPPAVAPDFFVVDTPLGRVTDKGCRYELRIADDGSNHVRVTEGAVTFAFAGRTVFVPAGAATVVTAMGPSTPLFADCSPAVRKAAQQFDATAVAGSRDRREKMLFVLAQTCAEPRDSLPLWHVLRDDDPLLRELAEAELLRLVGPPLPDPGKAAHWDAEVWLAFLRLGPWIQAR